MGKTLYGLLFVAVLPLGLLVWARATDGAVGLPTPCWPMIGWTLASLGVVLMLAAMRDLWSRGGGLPMNAYPPARLVTSGLYGLVPHPIYVGFCAACLGSSIATGSPGGLWLVTPMVVFGCVALVKGYEGPALRERFGGARALPLLRPPEDGDGPPSARDRLVVLVLLFAPWLALYEGWGHAQPGGLATLLLPGESDWPVMAWTTYLYSLAYPFTLGVPLLVRRCGVLRRFFDAGVVAVFVVMFAYTVFPVQSPPRGFDRHAAGGWLLALERSDGLRGAVAFPSFHVVWAILSACAYSRNGRAWGIFGWSAAIAISVTCVTTGMHGVADVAAAAPFAALAWHWARVWALLVDACERIANSWSCVRIGPARVINYAAFAGLAAATGMFLSASLAGPGSVWRLGAVALAALVGAGASERVMAGTSKPMRPFGYFGAVSGAAVGLVGVGLFEGRDAFWTLAGALSASGPWIVAIGRLRCLVQGCCHGKPIEHGPGIRYRHPLSRACRIAHLDGVSVHPTPLYSMASNTVIGVILARLWGLAAPLSLIVGVYLLLAGTARFVEESRRGEPQTGRAAGLPSYQWCAVASVAAGAVMTGLPAPIASGMVIVGWEAAALAAVIGAVYAFAMGIDFPDSNRRFSRLV